LSDPHYDNGHGERIFINTIGAAGELFPDDLDETFFDSDLVAFGGTALVPNIHRALGSLLRQARERKAITVVNTVYDFLSEKQNPEKPWPLGSSLQTYSNIDLLITDREEALRLSGTETVEAALAFFRSTGTGAAIITHGSKDLHYYSNSELFGRISPATMPVSERIVNELRIDGTRAGDTTGCGDNFAGGVIASIAGQRIQDPEKPVNLQEAIALGVVSGGLACFYYGGTFYEEFPGQKARLVEPYFADYQAQLLNRQ
jgi:sugar/nucleoside kinase (ribokinase family)